MEFSFLHGVLIFSKVWVSDCKLRWLFSLLLTRVISCDIDPWERLDIIILLCPPPFYLKGCQFCPMFLRKGIMEPALPDVFDCPLAWSCPQVFKLGLGMRLYERRFGFWQGVVFMQNFWNFKAIPQTEIILTSIQSRLILKKFKWFLWRGFQKWWKLFVLILVKMWSDIWLVTKGWNINLRVIENCVSTKMWKTQSDIWRVIKGWNINLRVIENRVSTKMWRTRSDIWRVTKRFKFQFEGFWEPCFKAFILFAWIMILFRMRKHCLPIQIACLWSERAW